MHPIAVILAAAALAALSSCGQGSGAAALSGPAAGGPIVTARLDTLSAVVGTPFNLRIGQSARVVDASLIVSFRELREDSRCPIGAQCAAAGNAQIVVGTVATDGTAIQSTLNLTGNNQFPSRITAGGFDVSFQALTPSPTVNATIGRDQYVAAFVVTSP